MYHTNEQIIKHKVRLLNLAEELGNVSKACQIKSRLLHVLRIVRLGSEIHDLRE
jgi:hypothetical protein